MLTVVLLQFECCFGIVFFLVFSECLLFALTCSCSTFTLCCIWCEVTLFNTLKYGVNVKHFACKPQVFLVHVTVLKSYFCSADV